MRQWIIMLIIAGSSLIFTACNKGGSSASTPDNCTQNTYGQWVNQNGTPCTPGYNQYSCLNNTYMPPGGAIPPGGYAPGAYPYQQGQWMGPNGGYPGGGYPGGYPGGGAGCSYANFQNTFPYNVAGYGAGCSYWSQVYPGNIYAPMNMGGTYVCVNMTSLGYANYGGGMINGCIAGYNCGGGCNMNFGVGGPNFWLGMNIGMCGRF